MRTLRPLPSPPSSSYLAFSPPYCTSFLYSLRPNKRFRFLSLEAEEPDNTAVKGTILAGVLLVGVVGGFAAVGYIYKDQFNAFLNQFSGFIEGYGAARYALFVAVYAGLEILAIPAIPLTMSAGLLFGCVIGTIIFSISGTVAASVAFLIAT